MTYSWYDLDYVIYIRAYFKSRVSNRTLYKVIILPPYSPGVPPLEVNSGLPDCIICGEVKPKEAILLRRGGVLCLIQKFSVNGKEKKRKKNSENDLPGILI